MGVVAYRELPRVFEREIGKSPSVLTKRYVCTLSDDTLSGGSAPTLDEVGVAIGLVFPASPTSGTQYSNDYPNYKMRKVRIEEGYEGNPYEILVTVDFGVIDLDEVQAPTSRAATWKVESQTVEVPALYYFDGTGNNTKRPLTNSAYDYFQGLTSGEPVCRLRYFKNFPATRTDSPAGSAASYGLLPWSIINAQNSVNHATWGSAASHTCRVDNVTIEYEEEDYGGVLFKLWKVEAVIAVRASSWNLQLPDVGWNFIAGGQKRRAMVFDFQNGEWIPSPNPVGLDGSGNQTGGVPAVLNRRICPEVNFTTLFGLPPGAA